MTMTAPDSNAYAATVQHLTLLTAKVARLNTLRVEAEEQLITRLAADYHAGLIGAADVFAAFQACREIKAPHFRDRWNARMPEELHYGNWRGVFPFTDETRTPANKISVVYVLYDAHRRPCYVGSTDQFRTRIRAHAYDGKKFDRWLACPCPDREDAYRLEDRLLKQYRPYLNHKAGQ